jgi:hypothetical protein
VDRTPMTGYDDADGGITDFLSFRWMITPPLVMVLWILTVGAITVVAVVALNSNPAAAVIGWILAMIWVRVVFEVMIVLFRINDGIQTMARRPPVQLTHSTQSPARAPGTKVCPDCAEEVRAESRLCRFCRHEFSVQENAAQFSQPGTGTAVGWQTYGKWEVTASSGRPISPGDTGELRLDTRRWILVGSSAPDSIRRDAVRVAAISGSLAVYDGEIDAYVLRPLDGQDVEAVAAAVAGQ